MAFKNMDQGQQEATRVYFEACGNLVAPPVGETRVAELERELAAVRKENAANANLRIQYYAELADAKGHGRPTAQR